MAGGKKKMRANRQFEKTLRIRSAGIAMETEERNKFRGGSVYTQLSAILA